MADTTLKITLVYLLVEFDKDGDVSKETSFRKKFTNADTPNLTQLTMDDLIEKFIES